jgi:hypothetical protein
MLRFTSKVAPKATVVLPLTITPAPLELPKSKIPALTFKLPLIVKRPDVTALNLPVPVLLIVKLP